MKRFLIHFLEFDLWRAMVLYANDDQSAREAFRQERPDATLLSLVRE